METIHYIILIIIIAIVFLTIKKENLESSKINNDSQYARVNPPIYDESKYLSEYYHLLGGYPYWYNPITPLPFNNPTRFTILNYPYLYPRIHDYFYPRTRYY